MEILTETSSQLVKYLSLLAPYRFIHDLLISQDKNGDSASTCIFFNVENFNVTLPSEHFSDGPPEGSVEIFFDDFQQNKCAKSLLGLTIDEATKFTKESFEKQFEEKPADNIWAFRLGPKDNSFTAVQS